MAFEKGKSGNPNGRKAGTPNKITAKTRDLIYQIVQDELDTLPDRLDKLKPRERIEMMLKLLPYVAPKTQSLNYSHPSFNPWETEPDAWSL